MAEVDGGPPAVVDAGADVVDAAEGTSDAPPDVVVPPCDRGKRFQRPELVEGLENRAVFSARFTNLEKTVFFSALEEQDAASEPDLFTVDRPDRSSAFAGVARLPVSGLGVSEYWPTVTADGKFLFFESDRAPTKVDGGFEQDRARIWFSAKTVTFDQASLQPLFDTQASFIEGAPYLDPKGRAIYFFSAGRDTPGGDLDLYEARLTTSGVAQAPVGLGPDVNTASAENAPVVSADELTLFFARHDGAGVYDIWMAKRLSPAGVFGPPTILSELNTADEELPSYVSDDECRLYFISSRPLVDGGATGLETFRVYVATRPN
jgi:hypothetical protein